MLNLCAIYIYIYDLVYDQRYSRMHCIISVCHCLLQTLHGPLADRTAHVQGARVRAPVLYWAGSAAFSKNNRPFTPPRI